MVWKEEYEALFSTKIYMCKKAGFLHEKAAFLKYIFYKKKPAFLLKYISVKKQIFYNRLICKKSSIFT